MFLNYFSIYKLHEIFTLTYKKIRSSVYTLGHLFTDYLSEFYELIIPYH